MKYLVVVDAGTNIYIDEFETLSEANKHAWYTHDRYQKLPRHCSERKHHIFVATPTGEDGDMNTEDNYFDSKTFYLPYEEDCFDNLWENISAFYLDRGYFDFVVGKGEFTFTVLRYLLEKHYDEELEEFDDIGGEIIFDYYKEAVREKRDEILAFFEMD